MHPGIHYGPTEINKKWNQISHYSPHLFQDHNAMAKTICWSETKLEYAFKLLLGSLVMLWGQAASVSLSN